MLALVKTGIQQGAVQVNMQVVNQIFDQWNYEFKRTSPAAALFAAWEFEISSYLQETKIESLEVRRTLFNNPQSTVSMYKRFREWSQAEGPVQSELCLLYALDSNNTCQQFMAFTLQKAIEFLESKFGSYKQESWQYSHLTSMTYKHTPFSAIPLLRNLF